MQVKKNDMELTGREKFIRTFRHKETDRIVMIDEPRAGTLRRRYAEASTLCCGTTEKP